MTYATREIPSVQELATNAKTRLLLVEDDKAFRAALIRNIGPSFDITDVPDGTSAADLLVRKTFDVVLTDIHLPGMTGTDLLRLVRTYDLDVPVVLMTGQPDIDSAIAATELGALMYLRKPFKKNELDVALQRASRLAKLARIKREAVAAGISGSPLAGDRAGLETSFERALATVWIAFQPIVETISRKTVAFEALVRTTEPSMPNPATLLAAAERLGRVHDLGRIVRARAAAAFVAYEGNAHLYLNLHPSDLEDEELFDVHAPLSKIASRVVLEITERTAIEEVRDAQRRARELRECGFRLAVDDLGAGYAGLSSLIVLEPEIVKLDMSLIRGIEGDPVRSRIVESISKLCRELNMKTVAEGIETTGELGRVLELGCDYMQGYWFGYPAERIEPSPKKW